MNERRIGYVLVVLLFLTFMSLAIQEGSAAITVTRHVICADVDTSTSTWKPVDIRDTFTTADKKVVAFLEYQGAPTPSHNFKSVWVAPNGTNVNTYTGEGKYAAAQWRITLTVEGTQLPVGAWKNQIYIDNSLVSTANFVLWPMMEVRSKAQSPKEGETIRQGETVTFTIELKNTGKTTLKEVRLQLEALQGVSIIENTPAKDMKPESTEKFTVQLKLDQPIEGNYQVELACSVNGEGWRFRAVEGVVVRVVVVRAPFLYLKDVKSQPSAASKEPFYIGDIGSVTYVLENTGSAVAKNVEVKVVNVPSEIEIVEVTTPRDLKQGVTDEWQVKLKASKPGTYEVRISFYIDGNRVNFKVPDQEETVDEFKVSVIASEKPFLQAYGLYIAGGVAALVVVIVTVLLMMRRKGGRAAAPAPVTIPPAARIPTPVPVAPTIAPPPTPPLPGKFCINCGAPMPETSGFCPKCGSQQP